MTDAILEAAARAMANRSVLLRTWDTTPESSREWYREIAEAALAAVTPLILERAAQTAFDQTHDHPELMPDWNEACEFVAAKIRALKEQP